MILNFFLKKSSRLLEAVLKDQSWNAISEGLKHLKTYVNYNQKYKFFANANVPKTAILIYFIGGVTYSEVAAIRKLS